MMAKFLLLIITVLFAAGLVQAQELSGAGSPSGDSGTEREVIKPKIRPPVAPSTDFGPVIPPQTAPRDAQEEPPQRFLWADVDNDGLKDLFVLDSKKNRLYHNLGNGGFEEVTDRAFVHGAGCGVTGFFGDYDGDGLADLFLFREDGLCLFRNGGDLRFFDVTDALGIDPKTAVEGGFLEDYDGDGFCDLLVDTPAGHKIFRNNNGQGFDAVELDGLGNGGLTGTAPRGTNGSGGATLPDAGSPKARSYEVSPRASYTLAGPTDHLTRDRLSLVYDTVYVNDNSPGSSGIGVPEVEGGDDAFTLNDIVDGTVTATDLAVPLLIEGSDPLTILQCTNSTETAIRGYSTNGAGVFGEATGTTGNNYGIRGATNSDSGRAVDGWAKAATGQSRGVYARCDSTEGTALYAHATASTGPTYGVYGRVQSPDGYAVYGVNDTNSGESIGIYGVSLSSQGYGVYGEGTGLGTGVYGKSLGKGVYGENTDTSGGDVEYGVYGKTITGRGVYGYATGDANLSVGVSGRSDSPEGYGVHGWVSATSGECYGVYGNSASPEGYGGFFTGRCSTDILVIRGGSDLSENFDIDSRNKDTDPEPGMVVCIDAENPGALMVSNKAYDHTVAGIISGAGGIQTGMLMGQEGSVADGDCPVALTGRVYCWVDASENPVRPGDLLTTSNVPGHAMKAVDFVQAHGAIIGKAMTSLESGRGLVLVLVALQ